MTTVWLGVGANLGDRRSTIEQAMQRLQQHVRISRRSEIIETPPLDAEGPDYLNCVAEGETELDPTSLLDFTQRIERLLGRDIKGNNAPRPIDIDILLYGDLVLETARLTLPHPRMHQRAFVLDPLRSLAPGLHHPVLDQSVATLADALPRSRPPTHPRRSSAGEGNG